MDVRYNPLEGDLTICFNPRDAESLALLMELVIEEEKERGTHVPNFDKDFFEKFSTSREKFSIKFGFEHLEFGVIFLEEVCEEMIDEGSDPTMLEHFLDEVAPYCTDNAVLH